METITIEELLKIIFSVDTIVPLAAIIFGYFSEVKRAREEHLRNEEDNQSKERIAEDNLAASTKQQAIPQAKLLVEASEDVVALMRAMMAEQGKENDRKISELRSEINILQDDLKKVSSDRDLWREEALSWESKYSDLKAESERQADEITTLKNKVRELESK